MRFLNYPKLLMAALLLAMPLASTADASNVPGSAEWYLHIDLEEMKSEPPGRVVYNWLRDEAFDEIRDEAGIDIYQELDSLTAFSIAANGPVIVLDGDFSQATKDKFMTFVAAEGDIRPIRASGRQYYRVGDMGHVGNSSGDIDISIESLEDGAFISMDIKNKLLITATEGQMQSLLSNKGRVAGSRGHSGALLVLTAEKTLLQAGMNSGLIDDDGDSDWDSNILRNTEQLAFMVAAAANKLAIEAKLITTEPEMAESLASVARGIISLLAFDDSMDAEAVAMLRSTRIEAKGNSLSLSLAVDPNVIVNTIDN